MEDRFTRGFVAGAVIGLVITLLNMLVAAVGIHIIRWVDWMGVILYDHSAPFTWGETFLSLIAMTSFNGALGIAFFYMIPIISSKNLIFKGWLWAVSIWFALDAITSLFKIDGLTHLTVMDALSDYASASLFGIFLAQLQYRFESAKYTAFLNPQPAMKPLDKNSDPEQNGEE